MNLLLQSQPFVQILRGSSGRLLCALPGRRVGPHASNFSSLCCRKAIVVPVYSSTKFHTSACFQDAEDRERKNEGTSQEEVSSSSSDKTETVTDRLRRLSMTPAEEYIPSAKAQEKANDLDRQREEIIRKGEQWKWDQRYIRPGGFQQHQAPKHFRGRGREDDWDEFGEGVSSDYRPRSRDFYSERERYTKPGGWRGAQNSNRWDDREESRPRQRRSSRMQEFEDDDAGPEEHELEIERLRQRYNENKARKAAGPVVPDRQEHTATSSQSLPKIASEAPDAITERVSDVKEAFNYINEESKELYTSEEDHVQLSLVATEPDTFGTLTFGSGPALVKDFVGTAIQKELNADEKTLSIVNEVEEEEEEDDSVFIPAERQERWSSQKLIRKIRALLAEHKLEEAVDTYLRVLKEGGFPFDHNGIKHHFNVLINECAKVGYVEMAFRLFNLSKKRGYHESPRAISSLLNACANSPWDKENNMDRIERLLINVKDRGVEFNEINYHALIKAYARLGETVLAFSVVDKMIQEASIKPNTTTFNLLLQACITDNNNGFRHGLITWRKMLSMKIRPDVFSYNLLLRVMRDCSIEIAGQVAHRPTIMSGAGDSQHLLPPVVDDSDSNRLLNYLCVENPSQTDTQLVIDNLSESTTVVDAKSLRKALSIPVNRFAVLGGLKGMISHMVRHKVGPNLKTLTALMEVTHSTEIPDILRLLKTYKIKPDIAFFNVAIRRCCDDRRDAFAKEMLKEISIYHLSPDIYTWGSLSLGCRSWNDAVSLLTEMKEAKFTPNMYVLRHLLRAAMRQFDPRYVLHIMEEARKREIPIDAEFLLDVEQFRNDIQRELVNKEMGKPVHPPWLARRMEQDQDFADKFALFKMRYKNWAEKVKVKMTPENPWKESFETSVKHKSHKPQPTTETPEDDLEELLKNISSTKV